MNFLYASASLTDASISVATPQSCLKHHFSCDSVTIRCDGGGDDDDDDVVVVVVVDDESEVD